MTDATRCRRRSTFPSPRRRRRARSIEVRPGIFWARLALPFRLDHVNIYLVEDGAGLALIDTGIDNAASRAAWEALLAGPLAGRKLTRHHRHPFPSRPHRPRRLAVRALRPAARHEPDRISDGAQHPARSVGAEIRALPRLLPLARAERGEHRDPARQRPALSAHGVAAAEDLPAADGGRPADDRRPQRSR